MARFLGSWNWLQSRSATKWRSSLRSSSSGVVIGRCYLYAGEPSMSDDHSLGALIDTAADADGAGLDAPHEQLPRFDRIQADAVVPAVRALLQRPGRGRGGRGGELTPPPGGAGGPPGGPGGAPGR